jgi:hypothetical protein
LLFTLRNVDHAELIAQAVDLASNRKASSRKVLADDVLGDVFGIEIESASPKEPPRPAKAPVRKAKPTAARKRVVRTMRKVKR